MSKRKLAGALGALALMAGGLVVATAVPAFAGGDKHCPPVRHENTGGIILAGTPAPTVTLLPQGVQVATPDGNDQGATWWQPVTPVPAAWVHRMSYWTRKVTAGDVPEAMPAYLLRLQVGDKTATLVYEPYGNPNDGTDAPPALGEKTWNVAQGTFWTTNEAVRGMADYKGNPHLGKSLADIAKANPGAKVVAFGWRQEWAKGLVAQVDKVTFAAGHKCAEHVWRKPPGKPTVTFADDCVGTVVKVASPDDKAWKFWLLRDKKTIAGPATVGEGAGQEFPVPGGSGEIVVLAKPDHHGAEWTKVGKHRWVRPADCAADISAESTCDELKVRVVVPAKSGPVKVVFTPSTGEPHELVAQPGSSHSFSVEGEPGAGVKVEVEGMSPKEFTWTEPADCDEPAPTPTATPGPTQPPVPGDGGGDNDDGLALTGFNAKAAAGIGGLAVAAGVACVVFLVLTRRRRGAGAVE